MKAQVFYTSLKLGKNENLLKKLERLVLVAGLETIDFKNKFVAISYCPYDAIRTDWQESSANMNRKVAEYTYAILKDKPHFHISFVLDVSPNCDCNRLNDIPIVGDIGFLASFDPVALDQACLDLVNSKPLNPTYESKGKDHFKSLYPYTFGEAGLEHAEGIGLGTRKYRLVEL